MSLETLTYVLLGLGLSAACGFRIFVPLLGMNIAHMTGHLTLAPGFEWMGSFPALIAFGTATLLETGAFYFPWLDNLLDAVAAPAAVVAGTIITASQIGDISPFMKWTLAAIAGGGVSGTVHGGTAALRAASTATTGGFANFIVATLEWVVSAILTVLAIFIPVLCFMLLIWIAYQMVKRIRILRRRSTLVEAGVE